MTAEALNGDAGAVDGNRRNRHRRRHPSEVKMAVMGPPRDADPRGGWDQNNQKKASAAHQTLKSQNTISINPRSYNIYYVLQSSFLLLLLLPLLLLRFSPSVSF